MSAIRLANRYAKSILQLAIEKGELENVHSDMQLLNIATDESRDFYLMLKSPIIHADKKMDIIRTIFSDKIGKITTSFLDILVRKGREGYLPEVIDVFIELYNRHKGITPVVLTTAVEASDSLIEEVKQRLRQSAGLKTIEMTTKVDERLIGGYILRYEDKQIDNSIARGLAILKDEFDNNDYIRKF